jgi:hypothetical protein
MLVNAGSLFWMWVWILMGWSEVKSFNSAPVNWAVDCARADLDPPVIVKSKQKENSRKRLLNENFIFYSFPFFSESLND